MPFSGDTSQLSLDACIGFSGSVLGGLQYTSCGRYIVYPMGSVIVVRRLVGKKIAILEVRNYFSPTMIYRIGSRGIKSLGSNIRSKASNSCCDD